MGMVIRECFYELAQSYYHSEARKVKSHRDFLNKTTHQLLFVRHQFKIAFFNELKQDSHTAIKNYKQAYGHLLELRMHDTNLLEIKSIAGFINYKICRLSFQHNAPLDAIAQFRKHIDFFKGKIGIAELAFEHSAWMSKQFQVFGDLFDEAIKLGLTAIQTQHPGFYYQQAANHAVARKQLCRGLCKVRGRVQGFYYQQAANHAVARKQLCRGLCKRKGPGFYYQQAANHAVAREQLCRGLCTVRGRVQGSTTNKLPIMLSLGKQLCRGLCTVRGRVQGSTTNKLPIMLSLGNSYVEGLCKPLTQVLHPDPLENLYKLDFYGQRPWRQGHQSIEAPDLQREKDGVLALQSLEVQEDHSWLIIPLLSSAVAQFKKYKSPRMKRYLMVQMGEEYFHAKDYSKSLMLLNKVMWDYRAERWWLLLTSILDISLKCAYLTAKVQDYVSNCMELIGTYSKCSVEEKTRIQMNLIKVMSNDQPEPEPGLDPQGSEAARRLWQTSMDTPCSFTIEMQNIVPFVECKARFTVDTVSADKEIELDVFLRASCQFPVRFSKLSVFFSNQLYNQYCIVIDGHGVSAASESESTGADLYLVPGKPKSYKFSFLPVKDDVDTQLEITAVVLEFGLETGSLGKLKWVGGGGDAVTPLQTALVTHRPANVNFTLHHDPPCLLNEFYQLVIDVENKESLDIMDVSFEFDHLQVIFGLKDQSQNATNEQTAHISMDKAEYDGNLEIQRMEANIGVIQAGKMSSRKMYIKNMQTGSKTVLSSKHEIKRVGDLERRGSELHGLERWRPNLVDISCHNHNRSYTNHCVDCKEFVCPECMSGQHGKHKVQTLDQFHENKMEELNQLNTQFEEDILPLISRKINALKYLDLFYTEKYDNEKTKLLKHAEMLKKLLNEYTNELVNDLQNDLVINKQNISEKRSKLKSDESKCRLKMKEITKSKLKDNIKVIRSDVENFSEFISQFDHEVAFPQEVETFHAGEINDMTQIVGSMQCNKIPMEVKIQLDCSDKLHRYIDSKSSLAATEDKTWVGDKLSVFEMELEKKPRTITDLKSVVDSSVSESKDLLFISRKDASVQMINSKDEPKVLYTLPESNNYPLALHATKSGKISLLYLKDCPRISYFRNSCSIQPNLLFLSKDGRRMQEFKCEGQYKWGEDVSLNRYRITENINGHIILSCLYQNEVVDLNQNGKVMWKYTKCTRPHDLVSTTFGNIIVIDDSGASLTILDSDGICIKKFKLFPTESVQVEYSISVPTKQTQITCSCQKEEFITVTTVSPFDVAVKLQSMKFEEIENIQAEEPFILLPELTCTSPWPVEFKSSQLQMPTNIQSTDEETVSQIQGVCLNKKECATECFCLITKSTSQTSTSLGTYTVSWRRKWDSDVELPFVTTSFPLPVVNIEHIPISVDLRLPAYGSVKQLLPLCYVIHNRTSYPQEMEVSMEPNDNFMFSGNKQIHFRVLPGKPYNLMYNLFPLMAGHLLLPKLAVNMVRYPGTIDPIVQKMLPSHVFIKPTGKTLSAGVGEKELQLQSIIYNTNPTDVCNPNPNPINVVCNPNPNDVCNPNPKDVCNPNPNDVCNPNPNDGCNPNPKDVCNPNPNDVCNHNPNDGCNPNPNVVCNPNPNDVCNPYPYDVCNPNPNNVCNPYPYVVCNPYPNVVCNPNPNDVCNPNPNVVCNPNPNVTP
ncbi:TRAPPC11 [Mytilus edulis]|uniref:Trafficking protein particle complex subunit 11 n=1 Tax=Mytilus edulis TaxID=6550 RepID=A0A8S3VRI3_MYTED|nr:TRAPPC11 [Mytilus edulis]